MPAIHDFAADLHALRQQLPAGKRLLGLDLGTKTIGVAVSDARLAIATAHSVINRTKFSRDAAELSSLCATLDAGGLVVGLPLNMDGTEGPRAQSTRAFVRNLVPLLDLPTAFADERLSTVAAERPMLEADMSRKKRAARIDAAAAGFILQGALDRMARMD